MNAIEPQATSLLPGSADIVFNALPHPVLMVAPDGRIAEANVAAEDFFEISVPVLRRHVLRDLVPFGSPLLSSAAGAFSLLFCSSVGRSPSPAPLY